MKQRLETSGCDIYEFFRQDTTGRRKQMKQEKKGKAYVRSGFRYCGRRKKILRFHRQKENRTEDSRKEVVKDAERSVRMMTVTRRSALSVTDRRV